MPPVEHEPHFWVILWTRTILGDTFKRKDQPRTRSRSRAVPSSSIAIRIAAQKNSQNGVHDTDAAFAVKP